MMTEQQPQGCWGALLRAPAQKQFKHLNHQVHVLPMVGAIAFFIPLLFTVGDCRSLAKLLVSNPAQAETFQPYAQNGGITQRQIDHLNRFYAKQQSYRAILSLRRRGELGSPNYVSEFREVYEIRGGSRYQAPQKFHILYRLSPNCNYRCSEAYDWYRQ